MRRIHARWPELDKPLCQVDRSHTMKLSDDYRAVTCLMCKHAVDMGWHVKVIDNKVVKK